MNRKKNVRAVAATAIGELAVCSHILWTFLRQAASVLEPWGAHCGNFAFMVMISLAMCMPSFAAATLDVELSVSHGVYTSVELATSRSVVYLVIDRSASMGNHSLKDGRTPDEALFESLAMQLDAIPIGTELRILPFSNKIWNETVIDSLDAGKRKSVLELVKKMSPDGQTLLYDAQDAALTAAEKIMASDANADVRVLVYTDGQHLTPPDYEGEYKARYLLPRRGIGRKRFVQNPEFESERASARKKFEEKFRDLFAKPNLEVEYEWLSAEPKPEIEMRTKAAIPSELASHTSELCNPLEQSQQTFKGALHLPISDKCWEEVKGKSFTVEWIVGGKRATGTMKLDSGRQKCSIEWPSLPAGSPETATLTVRALPEGKKFVLKDTKSVSYQIPAFLKGVEIKVPEKEYYERDIKSTFAAEAIGRVLGYAWTIDGQVVSGGAEKLEYTFKDVGSHEIGVTARYVNGITASAKRTVRVWPTPVVSIVLPEEFDGDSESAALTAGSPIALKAKVEGAFDSAIWTFAQDDKVVATVPAAVKDGIASGAYTPKKDGLYDVSVAADGLAGKKSSEIIQIYVKPKVR